MRLFAQDKKVEALQRIPLFEDLSRKELTELARCSEDVEVIEGKVLCREGEIGQEFFVIMEGEVEVTQRGRHLATEGRGEYFGEISLLEKCPRVATVTAKTALRFFVLTGRDFRHLLDENPRVTRKMVHTLARQVLALSSESARS